MWGCGGGAIGLPHLPPVWGNARPSSRPAAIGEPSVCGRLANGVQVADQCMVGGGGLCRHQNGPWNRSCMAGEPRLQINVMQRNVTTVTIGRRRSRPPSVWGGTYGGSGTSNLEVEPRRYSWRAERLTMKAVNRQTVPVRVLGCGGQSPCVRPVHGAARHAQDPKPRSPKQAVLPEDHTCTPPAVFFRGNQVMVHTNGTSAVLRPTCNCCLR